MFEIKTQCTIEESGMLQNQAYRLNYIKCEVDSVVSALNTLSGMDSIISDLKRIAQDMEEEKTIYTQMTNALDKINYCYISGENRIIQNAEQSKIVFRRVDLEQLKIEDVSTIINEKIVLE